MDPFSIAANLALVAAIVMAGRLLVRARRRGVPTTAAAAGAASCLTGLLTLVLASLHLIAVSGGALRRLMAQGPAQFTYEFRLYALLLMGAVIATTGYRLLDAGVRVTRGDRHGWAASVRTTLVLLALVLPLIPIQPGFGIGISAFAIFALGVLLVARRAAVPPIASPGEAESASDSVPHVMS